MIKVSIVLMISLCSSISFAAVQDTVILLKMLGTEVQSTAAILKMLDIAKENVERVEAADAVIQKTRSVALNTDYMVFRVKTLPKRIKRLKSISDLRDNMNTSRAVIRGGQRYAKNDLNLDITGDGGKSKETLKEEESYTYENMKKRQALLEMNYEWANSGNEKLREIGTSRLVAMNAASASSTNAELIRQGEVHKLELIQARLNRLASERRNFEKDKALGLIPNICFEDYLSNNWSYPTQSSLKRSGNAMICKASKG